MEIQISNGKNSKEQLRDSLGTSGWIAFRIAGYVNMAFILAAPVAMLATQSAYWIIPVLLTHWLLFGVASPDLKAGSTKFSKWKKRVGLVLLCMIHVDIILAAAVLAVVADINSLLKFATWLAQILVLILAPSLIAYRAGERLGTKFRERHQQKLASQP